MRLLSRLGKVFYIISNAVTLIILFVLSMFFIAMDMYWISLLLVLACIDPIDDIYFSIYRRHLYPVTGIGFLCNYVFEMISIFVSIFLLMLTFPYLTTYRNWFWISIFTLVLINLITSVSDLTSYVVGKKSIIHRVRRYLR